MDRRQFLKTGLTIGAAAALPDFSVSKQLAEQSEWIKVQLPSFVGADGRMYSSCDLQRNGHLYDINVRLYEPKRYKEQKDFFLTNTNLILANGLFSPTFVYEISSNGLTGLLWSDTEAVRSNIPLKHFSHCPVRVEYFYIVNGKTEPVTFSFVRDDSDSRFGRPYARIPSNIFEALSKYEYCLERTYYPLGVNGREYFGPVFASYRSEEAAMLDLIQAKQKLGV